MNDFDEVCFLCGVSPVGPTMFTSRPDLTAQELANALLKHFPNVISTVRGCKTKKHLRDWLYTILAEDDLEDFHDLSTFEECIAIGYFDDHGYAPRKEVDDPVVKYLFLDGKFVTKQYADQPYCGDFERWYQDEDSDTEESGDIHGTGGVPQTGIIYDFRKVCAGISDRLRTGATSQGGFGNFFLSRCCLELLRGWIERDVLPPMWDGRQLSFIGELWEIVNSRKTGRKSNGCLEWLEPGGAEKKLKRVQLELSAHQGEVYPAKTAMALQSTSDRDKIRKAIYDDYGYWMFELPNDWPCAPESQALVEVTALGFDVPPRASETSSSLGYFSGLAFEILCQILGHLPDIATYLSLKMVCRGMHDIIMDTKLAIPVLKEIIQPDPAREMFWIYPLEDEAGLFQYYLHTWFSLKCPPEVLSELVITEDILFHRDFPLIQFIHALYTNDSSRNRRRLWRNVKKLEEVWIDYRVNGWEVNRFGLPHAEPEEQ